LLPARYEQWARDGAEADGQEFEETITSHEKNFRRLTYPVTPTIFHGHFC